MPPIDPAACRHAAAAARTLSVCALGQNRASGPGRNHTVSPGPMADGGLAISVSSITGSGVKVAGGPSLLADELWSAMTKLLAVWVSPVEMPPTVSVDERSAFRAAATAGAYRALKLFAGASSPAIPAALSSAVCSLVHKSNKSFWAVANAVATEAISGGVTSMVPVSPPGAGAR